MNLVAYTPNCQIYAAPQNPFPTSIPSGTTWYSGGQSGPGPTYQGIPLQQLNKLMGALNGFNGILAALKASQSVTITVQRYLDQQCTIPVGAAGTATTTANTAGYVNLTAVVPAMYADVQIVNASGNTAFLTNPGIILMPNP